MLLTTKEVAAVLRVHPKHVYRLLRRGLPAHRVGDEWRFEQQAVLAWAARAPRPFGAEGTAVQRPPLLAGNGDVALEVLFDDLGARSAPLLGLVQADHTSGLDLLRRGDVLAAGCHGDAAPPAEAFAPRLAFLHVARRELGLAFPLGKRLRRVSSVVRRRLASRPTTAGIRACFDAALRREGVDPREANRGAELHRSHRDAVMAVVRGEAEVALASRAWALRAGLGFLPFATQGYGLAVPAAELGDARLVAICEAVQGGAFRRRLADDLGYDVRRTGELRVDPVR